MKTSRQNAKTQTAAQIAEAEAIMEAKLNGSYVSGPMTASVDVIEEIEEATAEQLANVGKTRTYIDENGVEQVTRSGAWLANI